MTRNFPQTLCVIALSNLLSAADFFVVVTLSSRRLSIHANLHSPVTTTPFFNADASSSIFRADAESRTSFTFAVTGTSPSMVFTAIQSGIFIQRAMQGLVKSVIGPGGRGSWSILWPTNPVPLGHPGPPLNHPEPPWATTEPPWATTEPPLSHYRPTTTPFIISVVKY